MDSTPQALIARNTHYVWDDDENEALCGADVSDRQWAVITPVNCEDCIEVEKFLKIFNAFHLMYGVRESLQAAVQVITSGHTI